MTSAGNTHIGGREHNEDSILIRSDLDLYVVADGAGGHNSGNIASALATTSVAHYFESTAAEAQSAPPYDAMGLSSAARRLATAFQRANRELIEVAQGSERHRGMGTTLVAAYFDLPRATLVLGHVGDSRCYRLRDRRMELLTQDHTLLNDVLELKPDLDPESAARLPRNVITNALGMDASVRVSVRTHEVAPGDRYLLCSDGLTDEVDDGQIAQALMLGGSPEEQVRLLIDLATEGTPRDNVAVVVLSCNLAPGAARLPEKPVPPRRRYADAYAGVLAEQHDDEADLESEAEPSLEVVLNAEDDEPEIEIVEARPASRRRRDDDTIGTEPER
jgi:serine/threonine protein phosphatase PrpC